MNVNQNLGVILLSIWLIATGLLTFSGLDFAGEDLLLAGLAIIAGLLILIKPASLHRNVGVIILAIWLILIGLEQFVGVIFPAQDLILAVLAVAAGILILLSGRRRE
jgi:hypothetical protein